MNSKEQEAILQDWLGRHRGLLIKVARSFVISTHDCEDLLQEIAFQVWKSIPGYQKEIAESTWLYRVALHTAMNWSRNDKKRSQVVREYSQSVSLFQFEREDDPRIDWLYEQIGRMKDIDRSLTLLLLDGFSYREMSVTLGISESNVGVRVTRIKKRLAELLNQEQNNDVR